MKKILYSISVLLLCALGNAADLKDWKMQREGSSRSYDVAVPCTVAGALNEAGVFGGNVLEEDHYTKIDKSLFKSVDIRNTEKINIPAREAKVLTPQPSNSYRIDKVYKNNVLSITNPEKFWGVSDFVVIQIDD